MPRPPGGSSYPRRVSAQEVTQALGPLDALQPIGSQSGSGECWLTRTGTDELVLKIVVHEHEPGRFQREVRALERLNSRRVMRVTTTARSTPRAAAIPTYAASSSPAVISATASRRFPPRATGQSGAF